MVKAYNSKVQNDLKALCQDHQLNVIEGGYDVGIHAARAALKNCKKNGNYALKIDFENAFNSIKRNFFLELIAAWLPHLMPSAWLYYSSPSKYFSNEVFKEDNEYEMARPRQK